MAKSSPEMELGAARIRAFFKKHDIDIGMGHSLEAAAIVEGYPNWDTAAALAPCTAIMHPDRQSDSPLTMLVRVSEANIQHWPKAMMMHFMQPGFQRAIFQCIEPFDIRKAPQWAEWHRSITDIGCDVSVTTVTGLEDDDDTLKLQMSKGAKPTAMVVYPLAENKRRRDDGKGLMLHQVLPAAFTAFGERRVTLDDVLALPEAIASKVSAEDASQFMHMMSMIGVLQRTLEPVEDGSERQVWKYLFVNPKNQPVAAAGAD